jgi:hypothetical protein
MECRNDIKAGDDADGHGPWDGCAVGGVVGDLDGIVKRLIKRRQDMYEVIAFLCGAVVGFIVGFFVGGKHKAGLMAKVEEAKLTASDIVRDAGKKL